MRILYIYESIWLESKLVELVDILDITGEISAEYWLFSTCLICS